LLLLASRSRAGRTRQKPSVYLQNDRPKNEKESNTRTIDGTVKDASDNPLADAIVQLKNTKTSKIVDLPPRTTASTSSAIFPWISTTSLLAKHNDLVRRR
jgi:hypothetical protein